MNPYKNNNIFTNNPALNDRIEQRVLNRAMQTEESNKQNESRIIDNWEQLASNYKDYKLSKEQNGVVTAARDYYNTLKRSVTLKDKYKLQDRRGGAYNGGLFPHSLKENSMVLAWIMKVGSNSDELKKMFPNQWDTRAIRLEPVKRVPETVEQNGIEISREQSFMPVLSILFYCLMCDNMNWDRLVQVKSKKASRISNGGIFIETFLYNIEILYTEQNEGNKMYSEISIMPRREHWGRRRESVKQGKGANF